MQEEDKTRFLSIAHVLLHELVLRVCAMQLFEKSLSDHDLLLLLLGLLDLASCGVRVVGTWYALGAKVHALKHVAKLAYILAFAGWPACLANANRCRVSRASQLLTNVHDNFLFVFICAHATRLESIKSVDSWSSNRVGTHPGSILQIELWDGSERPSFLLLSCYVVARLAHLLEIEVH